MVIHLHGNCFHLDSCYSLGMFQEENELEFLHLRILKLVMKLHLTTALKDSGVNRRSVNAAALIAEDFLELNLLPNM